MLIEGSADFVSTTLKAALVAVLLYVIVDDLKNYRIRNEVVLLLVGLFVLECFLASDWSRFLAHGLFGAAMFGLLLLLYHFGWMGGGDIKLLCVAFLSLGMNRSSVFALFLSGFAVAYAVGAHFRVLPFRAVGSSRKVPYGPTIAAAWLATLFLIEWS
jgi:prepilin peptidase CpaA